MICVENKSCADYAQKWGKV